MRVTRRTFLWAGGATVAGLSVGHHAFSGQVEDLGLNPVQIGRFHDMRVGPDASGRLSMVYMAFAQTPRRPPFLLAVDSTTGKSAQYFPPRGCEVEGFKSVAVSRQGYVYVGGYDPARLLRFDPGRPQHGLQDLGEIPGADMVWWMLEAGDGRVFLTTSSEARLYSWDPTTRRLADHGRLSESNRYATVLLANAKGDTLYAVVAPEQFDVIAYDVARGTRRGLLDGRQRGVGFIGIDRDIDGNLSIELPSGNQVEVANTPIVSLPSPVLFDGRRVRGAAEELVFSNSDGAIETLPLKYEAVSWLFSLHTGPDGNIYGFTHGPLRLVRYEPVSARWTVFECPVGTSDTALGAAVNWRGRIVLAAYPGCDLAIYDPSQAWKRGSTSASNPWTLGRVGLPGHTRPQAAVAASDGLVYIASDSSYGVDGGAVACLDPATGTVLYNIREPFAHRAAVALAADPVRPVVYIGCTSMSAQGDRRVGGSVVAWDTARRRILWEREPWTDAASVSALAFGRGLLYGTTYSDYNTQQLFVMAPVTGQLMSIAATRVAAVIQNNLAWRGGWLYGFSFVDPTLFRVHPETYEIETIARVTGAQGYTFALAGDAAYFSSGTHLLRVRTGPGDRRGEKSQI